MQLFFSVQLGHLKLSGYGLLSTQGVQNRSQNCWIVSQSEVMLQYMRDPGAPAASRTKGVNYVTYVQYIRNAQRRRAQTPLTNYRGWARSPATNSVVVVCDTEIYTY